jgi:hypothetical protein
MPFARNPNGPALRALLLGALVGGALGCQISGQENLPVGSLASGARPFVAGWQHAPACVKVTRCQDPDEASLEETERYADQPGASLAPWPTEAPSEPGAAQESALPALSLGDDVHELLPMLAHDARDLVTWPNVLILGAGIGGSLAIRENADGDVRAYVAQSPDRWNDASEVLRQFGEAQWQVPALACAYGLSLWSQDDFLHEVAASTISAYALTSAATLAIKGVAQTQRPSTHYMNGEYGFPSFHASSTFAIAATIDEYYGLPAGLAAYALAGLVGFSRIDQQEHDLSDVVFGALLGLVIGKSVARSHQQRWRGLELEPYYDPIDRGAGLRLQTRF